MEDKPTLTDLACYLLETSSYYLDLAMEEVDNLPEEERAAFELEYIKKQEHMKLTPAHVSGIKRGACRG